MDRIEKLKYVSTEQMFEGILNRQQPKKCF